MEGRIRIQNYFDKLEKWSEISKMKFNKDKSKVLGKEKSNAKYKIRNNLLGSRTGKKNSLGFVITILTQQ